MFVYMCNSKSYLLYLRHSCGVWMLISIKEFVEGCEELRIKDLEEARWFLLTQDILSLFNLERDRIKQMANDANVKKV